MTIDICVIICRWNNTDMCLCLNVNLSVYTCMHKETIMEYLSLVPSNDYMLMLLSVESVYLYILFQGQEASQRRPATLANY